MTTRLLRIALAVVIGLAAVQANALRLLWANTASSTASVTSKAAAAQDSDQVLRYQFATTTSTTVGTFAVKARNSAAGNIRVEFTSNSATAKIIKQVGTTSTQLGTFNTTVGTTPRWVRLNVTGTNVKVRIWADGTTEPSIWDANLATATGVTTAGVPVLAVTRTSGTNSVTIDNYRHTDPTNPPAPVVTYGYNNESQVTSETLTGGTRTRTYTLGRLTNFTEALPGLTVSTGRTYDATGRIATETNGTVTTTYGYDAASQLTSAIPSTGTATSWTYGQIGQRLTETTGTTTTGYAYDTAGQLCWTTTAAMPPAPTCAAPPTGATNFTYDAAGRKLTETVTATNKVTYTYDRIGQLATAQRVNATTTTTQTRTYNQLHQLTGLANTGGSTTTTILDWDPNTRAAALTAITTAGSTTDLVDGASSWVAARTGATNNAIGTDIYGSVTPTTPTTGLARATAYTSFGTATGTATFEPRLGYRGELTLDNLTYLRARNFQPTLGQFTTTDPAPGKVGRTTLSNEYTYTNNSPLQHIDPLGLFDVSDTNIGGTGLALDVGFLETLGVAAAEEPAAVPLIPEAPVVLVIGGTVYFIAKMGELGSALYDLDQVNQDNDRAQADQAYAFNATQQMVNDGQIPPGMYAGNVYEDETPDTQPQPAPAAAGQGRPPCATNTGVGGPDFNQAMNQALEWLLARGFNAEVPTIGKFGSTAGRPIGMQTADGKVGFRVEFDARSGAHINVWAAKEKGPHFTFAASEATVERIQRLFEKC